MIGSLGGDAVAFAALITPTVTPDTDRPAVYRSSSSSPAWFLRRSLTSSHAEISFLYGLSGDIPLMCDWDGNGTKTPGVYRGGNWYLKNTNASGYGDIFFIYGANPIAIPLPLA